MFKNIPTLRETLPFLKKKFHLPWRCHQLGSPRIKISYPPLNILTLNGEFMREFPNVTNVTACKECRIIYIGESVLRPDDSIQKPHLHDISQNASKSLLHNNNNK